MQMIQKQNVEWKEGDGPGNHVVRIVEKVGNSNLDTSGSHHLWGE